MERIATANTAILQPGNRNVFQDLIPGTQNGTDLGATWHTAVQEEIMAVIESQGLVAAATTAQMLQALKRLAGGNVTWVSNANAVLTADTAGLVVVVANTASVTITLPAAAALAGTVAGVAVSTPMRTTIMRVDTTGANTLTVVPAGTDVLSWAPSGSASGFTMSPGQMTQLTSDGVSTWWTAVTGLPSGRVVLGAGSGNWVVPSGVYAVRVRAIGGGGGAGGSPATTSTQNAVTAGGNGGCFAEGTYNVSPGNAIAYTVGAGGTGGSGTAGGLNGGSTSFGSLLTCPGGSGSQATTPQSTGYVNTGPPPSAVATGGSILNGEETPGGPGIFSGILNNCVGGWGGAGWGGFPGSTIGNTNGSNATAPGSGGSGVNLYASAGPGTGGSGAPGLIEISW